MTDEIVKSDNAKDGDQVAKDNADNETKGTKDKDTKPRTVSFNRDVHVKRFGESNIDNAIRNWRGSIAHNRGGSVDNILIFMFVGVTNVNVNNIITDSPSN